MLTDKQKDLLQFLVDYQTRHGYLPSVREVMTHLRVRSTNTAQYHLNRLTEDGYLKRERGRARAFELTERARDILGRIGEAAHRFTRHVEQSVGRGIPIMGRITAGTLDLAAEESQGALELADYFKADESTFALRVAGDSMTGAGIHDGDLVIVRRHCKLEPGEIGVLIVDGETTCKYIHYDDSDIILRPANETFREIRIPRNHPAVEVCGRVIGVVRRI